MKILEVVHGFPPGNFSGTEVYAYNLACQLAKKHKVFVFHRAEDSSRKEYQLERLTLDGLDIFSVNNNFRDYLSFKSSYENDQISGAFRDVLDRVNPDIVHIQSLLYLGAKIIAEVKKRKIPLVFTLNDYWLICPQGQMFRKNSLPCTGENPALCVDCVNYQLAIRKNIFRFYYFFKKNFPAGLSRLLTGIYLNSARFCLKNQIRLLEERKSYLKGMAASVDLFICPSAFLRDKFIKNGFPREKTELLSYGIKINGHFPSEKKHSDKTRFAFIGNILPAKGLHILINAFKKIEGNNAELKIYGRAAAFKSILTGYYAYVRKIGRSRNIRFWGGFDNRDIGRIFQEIDVLVVPSLWYENSPLVIQESFVFKTPVIASDIGGIPELVSDNINGLLFRPGDENELRDKLSKVIENPSLLESFRRNIEPPKSIEDNAQELEGIYANLISHAKEN